MVDEHVGSREGLVVVRKELAGRRLKLVVDFDVDVHRHGGYYGGGCCYHSGVGVAAAIATTAIVTAAVVGTRVYTLPPSCTVVYVNGFTYYQCGGSWTSRSSSAGARHTSW
jgi:hypothetical protein